MNKSQLIEELLYYTISSRWEHKKIKKLLPLIIETLKVRKIIIDI